LRRQKVSRTESESVRFHRLHFGRTRDLSTRNCIVDPIRLTKITYISLKNRYVFLDNSYKIRLLRNKQKYIFCPAYFILHTPCFVKDTISVVLKKDNISKQLETYLSRRLNIVYLGCVSKNKHYYFERPS